MTLPPRPPVTEAPKPSAPGNARTSPLTDELFADDVVVEEVLCVDDLLDELIDDLLKDDALFDDLLKDDALLDDRLLLERAEEIEVVTELEDDTNEELVELLVEDVAEELVLLVDCESSFLLPLPPQAVRTKTRLKQNIVFIIFSLIGFTIFLMKKRNC
jgi:hypothetical protein